MFTRGNSSGGRDLVLKQLFEGVRVSEGPAYPQGIQMTATTPSMRAVRFETGLIELELSNRIQCKTQPGGSSSYLKLFGKCQVDLNLALGQIVKHQVQYLRRC